MRNKIIITKAYLSMLFFDIVNVPFYKWSELRLESKSIMSQLKKISKK